MILLSTALYVAETHVRHLHLHCIPHNIALHFVYFILFLPSSISFGLAFSFFRSIT
jgi:hypothetical protein